LAVPLVFGLLAFDPSSAHAETIRAKLDGYQVVSTQSTKGSGSFRATLDRNAKLIRYELAYDNLEGDILQSHIHFGRPGTNGGIVAFLCTNLGNEPPTVAHPKPKCPGPRQGVVRGIIKPGDVIYLKFPNVFPDTQLIEPGEFNELAAAIDAGAAYVVVHTEAQPLGELRGDIPGKGRNRP
jgi:hypothetical protein